MYTTLPTREVPLMLVADIVTFIGTNTISTSAIDKIQSYTGYGQTHVKCGITIAKMLNLIDAENTNTIFIPNTEAVNLLGRIPNNDTKNQVMRKYIQMYEPFVTFVEFCLNDNSIDNAARKVYALYGFMRKDSLFLRDLFLSWGKSTDIFSADDRSIHLTEAINERYHRYVTEGLSLNDDMAIRLHIKERLGEETSLFLEECDIVELVDAFRKYHTEPRDSIGCSGRAFENFLRRVGIKVEVDVTRKNGITQIINFIQSNNKIHNKQNSIGAGLGTIRNMSGHGIDPAEYEPWDLQSQSALAYAELALSTMRSIYSYVDKNILIF